MSQLCLWSRRQTFHYYTTPASKNFLCLRTFHTSITFQNFKHSSFSSLLKKIKNVSPDSSRAKESEAPSSPEIISKPLFTFQEPKSKVNSIQSTSLFKEGLDPEARKKVESTERNVFPSCPSQSSHLSNSSEPRKDFSRIFPTTKSFLSKNSTGVSRDFLNRDMEKVQHTTRTSNLSNSSGNRSLSQFKANFGQSEEKSSTQKFDHVSSYTFKRPIPDSSTPQENISRSFSPPSGKVDDTFGLFSNQFDSAKRPNNFNSNHTEVQKNNPCLSSFKHEKAENSQSSHQNRPNIISSNSNNSKWSIPTSKYTPMSLRINNNYEKKPAQITESKSSNTEENLNFFTFSMANLKSEPVNSDNNITPENSSQRSTKTLENSSTPIHRIDNSNLDEKAERVQIKLKDKAIRDKKNYSDISNDEPEIEAPKPKTLPKLKKVEIKSANVYLPPLIKVANLTRLLGVSYGRLKACMRRAGLPEHPYDYLLNAEDAGLIAMEFNLNPIVDANQAKDLYPQEFSPEEIANHLPRAPVVTIMGHVDHGKTTLLDTLRRTSVAAGEAGGITQHIGAFQVKLDGGNITFLDTPGHAAFSAMRARGAKTTDLVVLVIAADDGIMPQTLEAIQHATDANVPMIVALTKCDKPTKNIRKIKDDLLMHGVQLEDYGGDTQVVEISAQTGMGLDTLKETILTLAEVLDLKAPLSGPTEAVVLESHVSKGLGTVASIVVHRGTLLQNQILVAGRAWCRVKNILDENGRPLKKVLPGYPAQISGWREFPEAGDYVLQASDEDEAKTVLSNRIRKQTLLNSIKDAEAINEKRQKEHQLALALAESDNPDHFPSNLEAIEIPTLPLVIKADVSGTAEAIEESIKLLPNSKVKPHVISRGVGSVTKADIDIALASNGIIMAFNVKNDKEVVSLARTKKVDIVNHKIIYKLLESVREYMLNLLPPEYKYVEEAKVEVLKVFEMKLKGRSGLTRIAGCKVISGTLLKTHLISISRAGSNSSLPSDHLNISVLKYFKDDVTSIKQGLECAIELDNFNGFQEGDIFSAVVKTDVPKTL